MHGFTGMLSIRNTKTGTRLLLSVSLFHSALTNFRFFKDRHWLFTEFPELKSSHKSLGANQKFTIFEVIFPPATCLLCRALIKGDIPCRERAYHVYLLYFSDWVWGW